MELPKSSRTMSQRKLTYCTMIGWSRPSSWRKRSRCSSETRGPRVELIGSPGNTRMTKKTSVARMSTIGMVSKMRVIRKLRNEALMSASLATYFCQVRRTDVCIAPGH